MKRPRAVLSSAPSTPPKALRLFPHPKQTWTPLPLTTDDLSLPLTLPTGQTFLWKQTGNHQFTGPVGPHLISLKHTPPHKTLHYTLHTLTKPSSAHSSLLNFLNADVSLTQVWATFRDADSRFGELAAVLAGARVLRQDPVECLMQFLCSSNNNIKRIGKMVGFVAALGTRLGCVEGSEFFEFPTLERLAEVDEDVFRRNGFGYRAKYIVGTVKTLMSKPGGGAEWLMSLRKKDLPVVLDELCSLPGVGPKVAACVALFSLDQHHAIPVDTHVWKIATRDLLPELAGARITPKLCNRVAEAFVSKYGKYAGWAQTLLFIAELPAQKALLPTQNLIKKDTEITEKKIT